ncbi:hypothetical protein L1077_20165 [Pseudoalteromonas luteoviolacea]|uniref:hypothetical protein n=1 Tax=Pseudoalteromonas luteoviolacea TaxID=43657 RepID=UPI001F198E5D|nr:hypothetical protein [Pseudoalteromonas luteoviolacea]MCF6441755.1 hypothetical protein [Pseudoalteromonas luteoviolacea]
MPVLFVILFVTDLFQYEARFFVDLTADEGHLIGKVSGCGGSFDTYQRTYAKYVVYEPTEDCTIHTEFYTDEVMTGRFLFVEELDHEVPISSYFTIDDEHRGTLYGLDEIKSFSLTRTGDKYYQARLSGIHPVIVKLDEMTLIEVNGFDLSFEEDGTYLSWRQVKNYQSSLIEKRKVINSADIDSLQVEESSLVGRWYLTYGNYARNSLELELNTETGSMQWPVVSEAQQTMILEMDADNNGRMITGFGTDIEASQALNWKLNSQGKLILTTVSQADFAELTLFEERAGGFAFAIDTMSELNGGVYKDDWLRHGSGILFKAQSSLSLTDVVGQHRTLGGSDGFDIFADGRVVNNDGVTKKTASVANNILSVSHPYDIESNKADPHCDPESQGCELRESSKLEVLGIHEGKIYLDVFDLDGRGNGKHFVAYDFKPNTSLNGFEPHHLDGLIVNDKHNGKPRQWLFHKHMQTNASILTISSIDGETVYPINLIDGVIIAQVQSTPYRLKLLSNDSQGFSACWQEVGKECGPEDTLTFDYTPPKINVALNIIGEVTHSTNFELGYISFGQQAGVNLNVNNTRGAGPKLKSFEGCGLRIFRVES